MILHGWWVAVHSAHRPTGSLIRPAWDTSRTSFAVQLLAAMLAAAGAPKRLTRQTKEWNSHCAQSAQWVQSNRQQARKGLAHDTMPMLSLAVSLASNQCDSLLQWVGTQHDLQQLELCAAGPNASFINMKQHAAILHRQQHHEAAACSPTAQHLRAFQAKQLWTLQVGHAKLSLPAGSCLPPHCHFCFCAALSFFAPFLFCPADAALAAAATALHTGLCCFQCLL